MDRNLIYKTVYLQFNVNIQTMTNITTKMNLDGKTFFIPYSYFYHTSKKPNLEIEQLLLLRKSLFIH